jgi:hypothetical protein
MSTENEVAAAAYEEAGIELPLDATPTIEPAVVEPTPEPVTPTEPVVEPEPLTTEPRESQERKPRSIYNDLKDTRNNLKSERELREQAEQERDELKAKLDSRTTIPESDELKTFADKIGADPEAIREMRELFLKGQQSTSINPELQSKLDAFETWQKDNGQAIAKQQFEAEFTSAVPQLQKMFPTASAEDISSMRKELDTLAHTTEFHDKEIDYIAFKNQDKLSSLITPHKRGLESKGRVDATNIPTDFNPNADISKMSAKEAEVWESEYRKMSKEDGLSTDSSGRRMLL